MRKNNQKNLFLKTDIILIVVILSVGIITGFTFAKDDVHPSKIEIYKDNTLFGIYDIYTDKTINITSGDTSNEIQIKNGTVHMASSNCKGKDCILQGSISATGETIICLPNKVLIEITGPDDEFDSITR